MAILFGIKKKFGLIQTCGQLIMHLGIMGAVIYIFLKEFGRI